MKRKIIVVGGGVAGLASAIRLQAKGFNVEIYEKENQLGGKMNQIKEAGFTFDVGPTIVMMPDIYKEVFTDVGKNPDDYFDMVQVDPIYSVFYSNGDKIDASTDLPDLMSYLEGISDQDAAAI